MSAPRTYGFLRASRRIAPGISVGFVTRGQSSAWFLFLIVLVILSVVLA